jgi:hydroxymethylpyrimidine/phosphomethylpyrimidine kinase
LDEAAFLTRREVHDVEQMRDAAKKLADLGPKAVLVKGGHLGGDAIDILFCQNNFREFVSSRIATRHTHGTGCTFSAAITAGLAWGWELGDAIAKAKHYITEAIRTNPGLGSGSGPLNHHAAILKPDRRP